MPSTRLPVGLEEEQMPLRNHRYGRSGAVLLLMAACAQASSPDEEQDRIDRETARARQAIEATNQRYTMHFNAGNGDSVAAIYAERGRVMWPNALSSVGRDSIASRLGAVGAMGPTLSLRTEEVAANGPLAVERGRYTMTWTPPGATPMADSGKYLMRWHRIDAQWVIVDNIWNSDLPSP
jgi:ketosteroid isomerase-like protein